MPNNWNSHTLLELLNGTATLGNDVAVSYKVKHMFTIWPRNPFLGIYYKEKKFSYKVCTRMFIAAFFMAAKSWTQPKRPSTVKE